MFLGTLLKPFMHGHIVITVTAEDIRNFAKTQDNVFLQQKLEDIAALVYDLPGHKITKVPVKW